MKKITFTLLLCAFLLFGCAVHRSKYFVPVDYHKDYRGAPTIFKVDTFENWDILISLSAYYGASGLPPEFRNKNRFWIEISATTYDKNLSKYNDTKYRVVINSLKIFYGKKLQNEIAIAETKYYSYDNDKWVNFGNADNATIHVPSDIKSVTVVSEIEFIDKDNNSTVKKFIIPMKRKEDSSIGPLLD